MQFVLNISVDNPAFGGDNAKRNEAVAAIVRKLANKIANGRFEDDRLDDVRDTNGDHLGVAGFCELVSLKTKARTE